MKLKKKELNDKSVKKIVRIGKIAAKLFNKQGYLQTSMEDISVAAKFSKGGIYHYFASKDEILFFILDQYMDLVLKDLDHKLEKIASDRAKFEFIISRHIRLYTENIYEAKTLLNEKYCLPRKHLKTIDRKERQYLEIVRNVSADFFSDEKTVTKDGVTVISFLLFGLCNWIYSWYDPKGAVNPEDLSEFISRIFLTGVTDFKT